MFKGISSLSLVYSKVFKLLPQNLSLKICLNLFIEILLIIFDIIILYGLSNPKSLNIDSDDTYLFIYLVAFIFLKNLFQILNIYYKNKLAFQFHQIISNKMFEFEIYCNNKQKKSLTNTESSLVLTEPLNLILNTYLPVFSLLLDLITVIAFSVSLIILNFEVALILIFSFLIPLLVFEKFSMSLIKKKGVLRFESEINKFKILRSLVSAADDISVMKKEEYFFSKFNYESKRHSNSISFKAFKNESVKNMTEMLVIFSLIILFAFNNFYLNKDFLSILLSLSFIGYRLIPVINRIIVSIQSINHGNSSFHAITESVNALNKELNTYSKLNFPSVTSKANDLNIRLNNFKLPNNKVVFIKKDIFLKRGEILVISGKSGAGKSTFLSAMINGRSGQMLIESGGRFYNCLKEMNFKIGSLSQVPFVFPATVLENISLSSKMLEKYDISEYESLLDQDHASELSLNNILKNNIINEDILSGGQRQRIGILRSFLNAEDVLILDEPTSALDNKNKFEFINLILAKKCNLFIIIVSHDEDIIKIADKSLHII